MKSGDRVQTGTGVARRRLTEAEAMAGGLPDLMTPDEWRAMHDAARQLDPLKVAEMTMTVQREAIEQLYRRVTAR